MFKLIVYSVFMAGGLGLFSCSSFFQEKKDWDPKSLQSAMATLEKEKEVHYGPSAIQSGQGVPSFAPSFIDITDQAGLSNLEASSINIVDFNGDGYSDLVLIQDYFSQPLFFLYDPKLKKFAKTESLFDESLKASYALFYDFDGDRITDALIGVLNQGAEVSERPLLLLKGYLKEGLLRFRPVHDAIKLQPGPAATVIPVDYDLDGDLDLYVGNWFSKKRGTSLPEKDYLLENRGGKFFDVSELLVGEDELNQDKTMHVSAAPVFSSQACDMDLNGFPDILAAATNGYGNKLWMNRYRANPSGRKFEDVGAVSFFAGDPEGLLNSRGGGRTFGVACADYNEDGVMDVFLGELSHNHDAQSVDRSSILTGTTRKYPPKFIRTEYVLDAHDLRWNQSDKRGLWFDYNGDGLLDLWVDNGGYPPHTRALLFKQYPDHSFENVSKEAGVDIVNPHSSVLLDFDKDGRVDVLTAQTDLRDAKIKKRLYLFKNSAEAPDRSARFYLRGNRANLQGIGAVLEVKTTTGNGLRKRTFPVSYSYGSLPPQNEEGVPVAFQEGEKLDSVKVVWPYAKSPNASKAGLEKAYNIKDGDIKKSGEITLCEIGIFRKKKTDCPLLR